MIRCYGYYASIRRYHSSPVSHKSNIQQFNISHWRLLGPTGLIVDRTRQSLWTDPAFLLAVDAHAYYDLWQLCGLVARPYHGFPSILASFQMEKSQKYLTRKDVTPLLSMRKAIPAMGI